MTILEDKELITLLAEQRGDTMTGTAAMLLKAIGRAELIAKAHPLLFIGIDAISLPCGDIAHTEQIAQGMWKPCPAHLALIPGLVPFQIAAAIAYFCL